MKIDDSFKKPGSIPFKWEIRPGVPKAQRQSSQQPSSAPGDAHHKFGSQKKQQKQKQSSVSPRLKPPPAGSYFQPHLATRSDPFCSPQNTHSARLSGLAQPTIVSSSGCFPSPLVAKRKNGGKRNGGPRPGPESEYYSDVDISSRWSVSSRKSNASPLSSSLASYQSSPRPGNDADWAGFGLF